MNKLLVPVLIAAGFFLQACTRSDSPAEPAVSCSEAWYRSIDERVVTGDGQGHGPDVGSDEWKSVVEFKLGIRGRPEVPARDGDAWCAYVDELVRKRDGER